MTIDKVKIQAQIEELLSFLRQITGTEDERIVVDENQGFWSSRSTAESVYLGAVGLFESLYGPSSPQVRALFDLRQSFAKSQLKDEYEILSFSHGLEGYLYNLKSEIESGLVASVLKQTSGQVLGDFVSLAKEFASAGNKDTSAVLAAAALEDALKRFATLQGLDVEAKDMAQVANALKANHFLKGPQAPLVESFIKLRNKALHAEWDKFSIEEVKSLIAFVDEFLLTHFS
jgi:hypothetical protein